MLMSLSTAVQAHLKRSYIFAWLKHREAHTCIQEGHEAVLAGMLQAPIISPGLWIP